MTTTTGLPPPGTPFPVLPSQDRVLELVAAGLSDKEIATALGLAHRTVRAHLDNVYETTGERGRARVAVLWALANALPIELPRPRVEVLS